MLLVEVVLAYNCRISLRTQGGPELGEGGGGILLVKEQAIVIDFGSAGLEYECFRGVPLARRLGT